MSKIVKQQEKARIWIGIFSQPKGTLTLTWDELSFVNDEYNIHIPIGQINSTSIQQKSAGTILNVQTAKTDLELYWPNDVKLSSGIGTFGGGFGSGMAANKTMNQNVAAWAQLIDDLRFGRLKNPDEPPAAQGGEKKCPMCAEMVKEEAKICRFCHYNFETQEMPKAT